MISILMPVYNEEQYLHACIRSIRHQSISDWELIAIDDFSTDSSFQILQEFAKKDQRIKCYRNKEKGIIPALTLAYAQSKGSMITRMDADDKMHPEKLESLSALLGLNPKACVTAKVEYFSEEGLADGFLRYAKWLNEMVEEESHMQHVYKECVVPSPCWMMHRNTIERIGGICGAFYPEDYDMVFRLYEHKVPVKAVSNVLHYWRDHSERASRNDPHYAHQDFIELKMHYLIRCDGMDQADVVLWGAGRTGKLWAKALKDKGIDFRWITQNEKKIGKEIYGKTIENVGKLLDQKGKLIVVAIKSKAFNEEYKNEIIAMRLNNKLVFLY